MNRIIITKTIASDGNLHLDLSLGASEAGKAVQVTVEPIEVKQNLTEDEWRAFVLATAGSIADPTFERQPQGAFEQREPLS